MVVYAGYLIILYLVVGAAVGLFTAPDPDRFLFVLFLWPVYLLMLVGSGFCKMVDNVFPEDDDGS